MENLILYLFYLLIMVNGQTNYIHDGDFENFIDDTNPTSGTWYNAINEGSTFFIRTIDGSKALQLKANPKEVCQNVTLPSSATYRIAYYYKGTSTITFSLVVDDAIILTKSTSGAYARQEVDLNLVTGSHKVCFKRTTSGQKVYIDNMTLTLEGSFEDNSTHQASTNNRTTNNTTNNSPMNNSTTDTSTTNNHITNQTISVYEQKVTYSVFEDSQTLNSIKIKLIFEDQWKQQFWLNQSVNEKVQIAINSKKFTPQKIKQLQNQQEYVLLGVKLIETLTSDSSFLLSIIDNSFTINSSNTCTFTQTRQGQLPSILYQSPQNQRLIESVGFVANMISETTQVAIMGISLSSATYLISSLFAFSHIICMYNYVKLKYVLLPYKLLINQFLKMFLVTGDINNLFELIFQSKVTIDIPAIPEYIPAGSSIDGMLEHGFSSNFLENTWDQFLIVGLLLIRLLIVYALCSVPIDWIRKKCTRVIRKCHIYILYEILIGAPTVILPIGYVFANGFMGFSNRKSKFNNMAFIIYSFILFFVPFLLHHFEIRAIKQKKKKRKQIKEKEEKEKRQVDQQAHKIQKNKTTISSNTIPMKNTNSSPSSFENKQEKKPVLINLKDLRLPPEKKKCNLNLIENLLLFGIPFLIGIGNTNLFICGSMILMSVRLYLSISRYHLFGKWELFKTIFNRLTWFSFNAIFFLYWLMEKQNFLNILAKLKTADKLGLASVIILTTGIGGQALFLVIDFFIWVKNNVRKCCVSNRISDDPKNKEKDQEIDQNKETKTHKDKNFSCKIENFSENNEGEHNNTESISKEQIEPKQKSLFKNHKNSFQSNENKRNPKNMLNSQKEMKNNFNQENMDRSAYLGKKWKKKWQY